MCVVPHVLIRARQTDIFNEFNNDMICAGCESCDIPKYWSFANVFHNSPELEHISVSALKRNFARCTDCCVIEAQMQKALKAHDNDALRVAKAKRMNHILDEKSYKFHYYKQR